MLDEEMSGVYLLDGRELTVRELAKHRARARVKEFKKWSERGRYALRWLGYALKLRSDFNLYELIRMAELEGTSSLYERPCLIPKESGGTRILIKPKADLMFLQRQINRLLKETFPSPPYAFGYRGGSCLDVAKRHVKWPSTVKFDVKDAFFHVTWGAVRTAISRNREMNAVGFSGIIARWIAKLCTYSPPPEIVKSRFPGIRSFLPQGAPTSSILFDLACWRIDRKLHRLAERFKGQYSRFADNGFFSVKKKTISPKLIRIIVCDVNKYGFPVHKIRGIEHGELCRILGYNCLSGTITNTREFRRKLRGALYVLRTKLERGLPCHDDWARVRGLMGFSTNLPSALQTEYKHCEEMFEDS